MSAGDWAAWAALGSSAGIYAIASLVAAVESRRVPGVRLPRATPNGDAAAPGDRDAHAADAAALAHAVAYAALIGAVSALFVALSDSLSGAAWRAVVSGGVVAAGALALHAWAGLAGLAESGWAAQVARPGGRLAGGIAGAPGLRGFLRRMGAGARLNGDEDAVTAAFEQNLDLLEAAGAITDAEELRMIRGVLDLDTTKVREIMRPRVDMVVAPATATRREVADLMTSEGYSKIPVYQERIDDIVGLVYARDLLLANLAPSGDGEGIDDLVRPAIFVPESQYLERLLQEFQRQRIQMAIVVDEYGGVSGLVTVQDLVEEIVGELEDEFDKDEPQLQRISPDESVLDARLTLDALNELFSTAIEGDGFDTVGGLVYRELGRMPVVGDKVRVDGIELTVDSTTGRRIRKLHATRAPADEKLGAAD